MRYRVRFFAEYDVDAANEEEALEKADYELDKEINSGWFTFDNTITALGTNADKQPAKSVKSLINSEKSVNYESDRDRKKALRQSRSILAKYKKG